MTSISDDSCPLAHPEIPNAWIFASAVHIRFQAVKQNEMALALENGESPYMTKENAADRGQVAAWLDLLARQGRLRVTRTTGDGGRRAIHSVEIVHEVDGEVLVTECGGSVSMHELRRGLCRGTDWLYAKEVLPDGWVRITLMITESHPDHTMFKRDDGSPIRLGFNDNVYFYQFDVTIHQDNLHDQF